MVSQSMLVRLGRANERGQGLFIRALDRQVLFREILTAKGFDSPTLTKFMGL
jgi:hypothetical protein